MSFILTTPRKMTRLFSGVGHDRRNTGQQFLEERLFWVKKAKEERKQQQHNTSIMNLLETQESQDKKNE